MCQTCRHKEVNHFIGESWSRQDGGERLDVIGRAAGLFLQLAKSTGFRGLVFIESTCRDFVDVAACRISKLTQQENLWLISHWPAEKRYDCGRARMPGDIKLRHRAIGKPNRVSVQGNELPPVQLLAVQLSFDSFPFFPLPKFACRYDVQGFLFRRHAELSMLSATM